MEIETVKQTKKQHRNYNNLLELFNRVVTLHYIKNPSFLIDQAETILVGVQKQTEIIQFVLNQEISLSKSDEIKSFLKKLAKNR